MKKRKKAAVKKTKPRYDGAPEDFLNNLEEIEEMAVEFLPNSKRYKFRFKVKSTSRNKLHTISFDNAPNAQYWSCSCEGNRYHGYCKHSMGLGLKSRNKKGEAWWTK